MKIKVLLLLSLLSVSSFFGQNRLKFEHYTQSDGLPNNQVQCIFQDSRGWIHIGTSYGMTTWSQVQPMTWYGDGNITRAIFEDSKGQLWVAFEEYGLCQFNLKKECLEPVQIKGKLNEAYSANSIDEDCYGNLWIGTNKGLYKYDTALNELVEVKAQFVNEYLRKLAFDSENRLWIGTDYGLYLYMPESNELQIIPLPIADMNNDEIWELFVNGDKLYVGTYNNGLFVINLKDRSIRSIPPPQPGRSKSIKAITKDHNGLIWVGTRAGLFSVDEKDQIIENKPEREPVFSQNITSILSLMVDAKGDLWVGTRGGLLHLNAEKQAFKHYNASADKKGLNSNEVFAFLCDNFERLWIGTEAGGINILDPETGEFRHITTLNSNLKSNGIKAFMYLDNEIWVGTYQGGISVFDEHSAKWLRNYTNADNNPASLADDRVWSFLVDSKGRVWIGTSKGVDEFDKATKTFVHHRDICRDQMINWMKEDQCGDIWFGGNDDLIIYNHEKQSIKTYKGRTRDMYQITEDLFLVATNHGLAHFSKSEGLHDYITEKDGLANNIVYCIMPDNNNLLWMTTANGLSRYNHTDKTFINYYQIDGLQENQFNYGAFGKTCNEEFLFGGINGFNIINPKNIIQNQYVPPVYLTELRVMNQTIDIKDPNQNILKESLSFTQNIELKYNQNSVGFSFLALNYAKPQKNQYAYKLDGFDKDWIYSKNQNTATYTNLKPGKYIFRVKASNNDGRWNEAGTSLNMVIRPPYWGTWWFMTIIIVLVLAIIYGLSRFYIHKENLKNKIVFERRKAKKLHELDLMKQQFFFNISHEIRTPLTLVIGPVENVLRDEKLPENDRSQLEIADRNAKQLLKLINQLLDFRKLQTGKFQLNYAKGDMIDFVQRHVKGFQYLANEKGINLHFSTTQKSFLTWIDSDKLEKILNNLISNALKFTDAGGDIWIKVSTEENYTFKTERCSDAIKFIVQDTGIGISEKNLPKIFNRFFQSMYQKGTTGSGIGLNITHDFVQLMGGEIEVSSKAGEGSMFTVRLPVLSDEEVSDKTLVKQNSETADIPVNEGEISSSNQWLLVVDDNEDIRNFIKGYFQEEYNILEARNGKEAFELAVKHIPDLVISDVIMPVMDGTELCKKLKKDERTSHIPILLLTAAASRESEMEGLIAGADDYITKPFDIKILNVKVDNLLALRTAMREKFRMENILQPENKEVVTPDDKFLQKALQTVEKYMDDSDLDIELFAKEVGVSRMQLYRKMQALTNMTVKEFIRDIRLKRAAQLLASKKFTVAEVTYQVGFKDIPYFRKCFKDAFGVNPSEYKE